MKKSYYTLLFIFLLIFSLQISQISTGWSCYLICMTLCEGNPASVLATIASFGIFAAGCAAACAAGCAAGIAFLPMCFSENSTIIVKDPKGALIKQKISEVKRNDMVLTLENNTPKFTLVVSNHMSEGNFEFLKFKCQEKSNGQLKEISVTPDHAMAIQEDEGNKLLLAKNVLIGKSFVTENGICDVIQIEKTYEKVKYTLSTAEGTILVSSILSSTICDSDVNENSLAEEVLSKWRKNHHFVCYDSDNQ